MAQQQSSSVSFRIMLLGNGGVGKTCITLKYIYDEFEEVYEPSQQDLYTKTITKDGKSYPLFIIDTAGQEGYARIVDSHIRESNYFLLVFALDDIESFKYCSELRECIQRLKEPMVNVPMALVGNKVDLVEENPRARQVSKAEAETLAAQWNIPYYEASAKKNIMLEDIFQNALTHLIKDMSEPPSEPTQEKTKKKKRCSIL